MEQKLSLRLDVEGSEKSQGEVSALRTEFIRLLEQAGKKPEEIAAFFLIADGSKKATGEVAKLDDKTKELISTYQGLKTVADARDKLNLIPHERIKQEIEEVKRAYDSLKTSGTLSHRELAQAALKTETAIRELEGKTNGFLGTLEQMKGSLIGAGAAFGGLTLAARQAMQFESAMADVRKVVEGSDEEFAGLTRTIKDLSGELPISADGLAKIAAAGGQLGIGIERIAEFTRLAAQMATAFNMSAEEAGQAVAKLSNVFHLPLDGVRKLGDAVNVLGNNTAATEAAIVDVLTRIGGSAVQFGLASDQAAALAATMLSLGTAPQVVATGLNAMMARLQTANTQSDEFKQTLKGVGIEAQDLAERIRTKPQEALLEFMRTLSRLDSQSKAETLVKLFGLEYQDDIARLIGSLGQYEDSLGLIGDKAKVAGAMQAEFAARMETTDAQIELLKNAIETIGINLGTVFLPMIKTAASGLADISRGIASFAEEFPVISGLIATVATLGASLGALRVAVLAARVAFGSLLDGLPGKFSTLNKSVLEATEHLGKLKTAGLLASAAFTGWEIGKYLSEQFAVVRQAGVAMVAGLVEGAEYVRYAWETAKAVFTDDTIEAATARHLERLSQIREILTEQFIEAGESLQESAAKTASAHETAARGAEDSAARQVEAAAGAKAAQESLAEAVKALGLTTEETAMGIATAFETIAGSADATADRIWQAFEAGLKKAGSVEELEGLKTTLTQLGQTGVLASERVVAGLEALDKAMAKVKESTDPVQQAFNALGIKTAEALEKAADEAKKHYDTIVDSGLATTREIEAAFAAYAKSALGASRMVSPAEEEATRAMLAHEAAIRGAKDAWEKLVPSQEKAREQATKTKEVIQKATAATKEHTEATEKGAQALDDMGDKAAKARSGLTSLWSERINTEALSYLQDLNNLSGKAAESLGHLKFISESLNESFGNIDLTSVSEMDEGLGRINDAIGEQNRIINDYNSNFSEFWRIFNRGKMISAQNARAVLETTRGMLDEAHSIEEVRGALLKLTETETTTLDELKKGMSGLSDGSRILADDIYGAILNAEDAMRDVQLLGDENLGPLQSAIDEAKRKLEDMAAAARDAERDLAGMADSMTEELLRIRGDDEKLEEIAYQKRLAQIKELHRVGGELTNDEYKEAKRLADQLHQEELTRIKERKKTEALHGYLAAETRERSPAPTPWEKSEPAKAVPVKTVRIDFGGIASGEFSEEDAGKLIQMLKNYGIRL